MNQADLNYKEVRKGIKLTKLKEINKANIINEVIGV